MQKFVIVGGGLAAHQAAKGILDVSADARVVMVGSELQLPYDRPHLSKGFLSSNTLAPARLAGCELYTEGRAVGQFGVSVVEVDRPNSRVLLSDGDAISYDKLIFATGSRTKALPSQIVQAQVHYLRTFEDALTLRQKLAENVELVVIGGGFIGLEVCAAARSRKCRVTVIETQPRLLARAGSAELSDWILRCHRSQGGDVQLNTSVESIKQLVSGKIAIETSGGQLLADVVVAGIGVQPNIELAREAGLLVDNGVLVDGNCATSDPSIFAAGEVTNYPVRHLGVRTRSESWMAASDQGGIAGRAAAGDCSAEFMEMPWLWSDQFDSNIQYLGLAQLAAKRELIGDLESDQWLLLGWSSTDELVSAVAVNRGKDISAIRRAIKRRIPLPDIYGSAASTACA
jgi:NADPH-dependent 2,4-dienoyl-CoA reductase/sulfur reductase-like enzyme